MQNEGFLICFDTQYFLISVKSEIKASYSSL